MVSAFRCPMPPPLRGLPRSSAGAGMDRWAARSAGDRHEPAAQVKWLVAGSQRLVGAGEEAGGQGRAAHAQHQRVGGGQADLLGRAVIADHAEVPGGSHDRDAAAGGLPQCRVDTGHLGPGEQVLTMTAADRDHRRVLGDGSVDRSGHGRGKVRRAGRGIGWNQDSWGSPAPAVRGAAARHCAVRPLPGRSSQFASHVLPLNGGHTAY